MLLTMATVVAGPVYDIQIGKILHSCRDFPYFLLFQVTNFVL